MYSFCYTKNTNRYHFFFLERERLEKYTGFLTVFGIQHNTQRIARITKCISKTDYTSQQYLSPMEKRRTNARTNRQHKVRMVETVGKMVFAVNF